MNESSGGLLLNIACVCSMMVPVSIDAGERLEVEVCDTFGASWGGGEDVVVMVSKLFLKR